MRSRPLSFADALLLLGAGDDPAVARLGRLAGAGAAAVTVASLGTVDFFALRDEAVQWGNSVVGGLRERLRGLDRFDRTQRLVAAHSVIVVTSFFEAFDELVDDEPGIDAEAVRLTAAEQVAVMTSRHQLAGKYEELVDRLVDAPPPMPAPHLSFEQSCERLDFFYSSVVPKTTDFILQLSVSAENPDRYIALGATFNGGLAELAVEKYVTAYRRLAVQAPEFGVWAQMVDAQATRDLVRTSAAELAAQLAELRAGIARISDDTVDAVRSGLRKRYRATLSRSILSSADAPAHVVLPTLGQGYVGPRGLVAVASRGDLPAAESWWERSTPVPDVQAMLLAHLTGPDATTGPLVVLGQPGSGKSVLTRMLAATLPDADFLVVRVELRSVHADASPQSQIESAIYQMLGERVTWPELVRRAGPALPVIIMDGFDELLQATGVNRADYLEQIEEFQRREAELDRPVAVLVTSRTVVADRARFPSDTVVVRLEPFDDGQVRRWLRVWNGLNDAGLRARSLLPLPPEVALAHGELASQPLLLLLLALYDAGANALQAAGGGLGRVELYERLFQDFIQREVDKHDDGRSPEQRTQAIEVEWRRLGAVALAMLNRGGDVITEPDLDADVPHLLHADDLRPAQPDSLRRPLTVSQLLVGRFFFIHESQAARDTGAAERTFEFLHATFGEFLAARQIVGALVDLAEESRFRSRRPGYALDAGYLWAATSFVTVARRVPLFEFCQGLLAREDADVRRRCRELALELLPDAGYPHPNWSLDRYEPRRKPFAARHAAFSANLVCFVVMLSDGPVDVTELVGEPVVVAWKSLALLWQSQLEVTDRQRLWQTFRVAWRLDTEPTVLEIRVEDGAPVSVYESLPWPTEDRPGNGRSMLFGGGPDVSVPAEGVVGRSLRRSAFVQTAYEVREHLYALMPCWEALGGVKQLGSTDIFESDAGILMQALFPDPTGNGDRPELLRRAALTARTSTYYFRLVLRQIVEEISGFSDEDTHEMLRLLTPLHPADEPPLSRMLAPHPDLVARLAAAITERGELTKFLRRPIATVLRLAGRGNPGFGDHVARAFAGSGQQVPLWADDAVRAGLTEP